MESTIRRVKKPATIKHVDNNLRASTLNALLLLTTGTSIHANFSIYIFTIFISTQKNERKIFANKCKEPETLRPHTHRLN